MVAFVVLVVLGLLSVALAKFGFGCQSLLEAVPVGLSVSLFASLLVHNTNLRIGVSFSSSLLISVLLVALLSVGFLLRLKPFSSGGAKQDEDETQPSSGELSWASRVGLCLCLAGLFVFTNACQVSYMDNDYWLHTPLMAHLSFGKFPPTNPFFPELHLQGHYARDLVMASFSHAFGHDVFVSQAWVTSFLQLLNLTLFFWAFYRYRKSEVETWFAVLFVFWGVNDPNFAGIGDHYWNNQPLANLGFGLALYLIVRYQSKAYSKPCCVLLTMLMAIYGVVYETYLGVLMVGVILAWTFRSLRNQASGQDWKPLMTLVLGGLLCLTQGGTFTAMAQRVLGGHRSLSVTVRNQSQLATIQIPSSHFLQIPFGQDKKPLLSSAYRYYPAKALVPLIDQKSDSDGFYVPLWSLAVARIHWLGYFMLPFTLWMVLRIKHGLGGFLILLGWISFLTPGIVDFGPIHKWEWQRFQFLASQCWSAALGIALANSPFLVKERSRLVVWPLVVLVAGLNIVSGLQECFQLPRRVQRAGGLIETLAMTRFTDDWILDHAHSLRLDSEDLKAIQFLKQESRPLDRIITNFDPTDEWGILFESTLCGYTGLLSVGRQLPKDDFTVGLPPRSPKLEWLQFLVQPSSNTALNLKTDWLYLKAPGSAFSQKLSKLPELTLAYTGERPSGEKILIYRVTNPDR